MHYIVLFALISFSLNGQVVCQDAGPDTTTRKKPILCGGLTTENEELEEWIEGNDGHIKLTNWTRVEDRKFMNCESLISVTIPDSVSYIGFEAFLGCESLTTVTIESHGTRERVGRVCGDGLRSIGDRAFYDCQKLSFVKIPASVSSIGSDAFTNTGPGLVCQSQELCSDGVYCNDVCGAPGCTASILHSVYGDIKTSYDLSCKSLEECEKMNEWCQSGRWLTIFLTPLGVYFCCAMCAASPEVAKHSTVAAKTITMTQLELQPKTVEEGEEAAIDIQSIDRRCTHGTCQNKHKKQNPVIGPNGPVCKSCARDLQDASIKKIPNIAADCEEESGSDSDGGLVKPLENSPCLQDGDIEFEKEVRENTKNNNDNEVSAIEMNKLP